MAVGTYNPETGEIEYTAEEQAAIDVGSSVKDDDANAPEGALTDDMILQIQKDEAAAKAVDAEKKDTYMAQANREYADSVAKGKMTQEEMDKRLKKDEDNYDEQVLEDKITEAENAADPDYIPPSSGLNENCQFNDPADDEAAIRAKLLKASPEYAACVAAVEEEEAKLDAAKEKKSEADKKYDDAKADTKKLESDADAKERATDKEGDKVDANGEISDIKTEQLVDDRERIKELEAQQEASKDLKEPVEPTLAPNVKPVNKCVKPIEIFEPVEPPRTSYLPGSTGDTKYATAMATYKTALTKYNNVDKPKFEQDKDDFKACEKKFEDDMDKYEETKKTNDKLLEEYNEKKSEYDQIAARAKELEVLRAREKQTVKDIQSAEANAILDGQKQSQLEVEQEKIEDQDVPLAEDREDLAEDGVDAEEDNVEDAEDSAEDKRKECDKMLEDLADKYPDTVGKIVNEYEARKEEKEDCMDDKGNEIACGSSNDSCVRSALGLPQSQTTDDIQAENQLKIMEAEDCIKNSDDKTVENKTAWDALSAARLKLFDSNSKPFPGKAEEIAKLEKEMNDLILANKKLADEKKVCEAELAELTKSDAQKRLDDDAKIAELENNIVKEEGKKETNTKAVAGGRADLALIQSKADLETAKAEEAELAVAVAKANGDPAAEQLQKDLDAKKLANKTAEANIATEQEAADERADDRDTAEFEAEANAEIKAEEDAEAQKVIDGQRVIDDQKAVDAKTASDGTLITAKNEEAVAKDKADLATASGDPGAATIATDEHSDATYKTSVEQSNNDNLGATVAQNEADAAQKVIDDKAAKDAAVVETKAIADAKQIEDDKAAAEATALTDAKSALVKSKATWAALKNANPVDPVALKAAYDKMIADENAVAVLEGRVKTKAVLAEKKEARTIVKDGNDGITTNKAQQDADKAAIDDIKYVGIPRPLPPIDTSNLTEEEQAAVDACNAEETDCNKGFFDKLGDLSGVSKALLAVGAIALGATLLGGGSCNTEKFTSIVGGAAIGGIMGGAAGAVMGGALGSLGGGASCDDNSASAGGSKPDGDYLWWDAQSGLASVANQGVLEDMIASHLQPIYKHAFVGEFPGKLSNLDWLVKTMDRPKMDVEYVEQIRNNVKRQYPIKYSYGDLSMTFHDDVHHKTITLLHKYWADQVWEHKDIKGTGELLLRDSIVIPIMKIYDLSIETEQHLCYTYKNVSLVSIDYDAPDEAEDGGVYTIQAVFKIEGFDVSPGGSPKALNNANTPIWTT